MCRFNSVVLLNLEDNFTLSLRSLIPANSPLNVQFDDKHALWYTTVLPENDVNSETVPPLFVVQNMDATSSVHSAHEAPVIRQLYSKQFEAKSSLTLEKQAMKQLLQSLWPSALYKKFHYDIEPKAKRQKVAL